MEKHDISDMQRGSMAPGSGSEVEGLVVVKPEPSNDPFFTAHSCSRSATDFQPNSTKDIFSDKLKTKLTGTVATLEPAWSRAVLRVRSTGDRLKPKFDAQMSSAHHLVASVGPLVQQKSAMLKETTRARMTNLAQTMEANPIQLAGIATGVGLATGLLGRYLKWRMKHPRVIVINASALPERS